MPRVTKETTRARRILEVQGRKQAVLDAAHAVFTMYGFQAASTDEIAARAGVSVGTVYNFFENKERLFVQVVEQVGREILAEARGIFLSGCDVANAVRQVVSFRLRGYDRHRVFFTLVSDGVLWNTYPCVEAVYDGVAPVYYQYIDIIAKILEKGIDDGKLERMRPLTMAISLEGILNGFVSYWTHPGGAQPLEQHIEQVTDTLMRVLALKEGPDESASAPNDSAAARKIYITRFDFDRLRELIAVANAFGSAEHAVHLAGLSRALSQARIVEAGSVPGDVVTMNSRVRLEELEAGKSFVTTLVFPADWQATGDKVSILDPLGTALLGGRVGGIVEAHAPQGPVRYEIVEMLYQPERAEHYHL